MRACGGPPKYCVTQYVNACVVSKSNDSLVCVYLLQDHRSRYCYGHCRSSLDLDI